jgi:hypothetical protein
VRALSIGRAIGLAIGLAALAGVAAPARAEGPDPRAVAAGRALAPLPDRPDDPSARALVEHGLEPDGGRRGIVVSIGVAPVVQLGVGLDAAGGLGGGFDLRLARVASPRWLVGVEFVNGWIGQRQAAGGGMIDVSQLATLALGGQYFARPGLWLRLGIGASTWSRNTAQTFGQWQARSGLGGVVGGGVALIERGRLTLAAELFATAALLRGGTLGTGGLGLALQVD